LTSSYFSPTKPRTDSINFAVIRQSIIHSRSNFKKTPLAETIGSLPMLGGMSVPLQMPEPK
jgi:hypothetical protein